MAKAQTLSQASSNSHVVVQEQSHCLSFASSRGVPLSSHWQSTDLTFEDVVAALGSYLVRQFVGH